MDNGSDRQKYTFAQWLVDSLAWCSFVFCVFLVLVGQPYGLVGLLVCLLWLFIRLLQQWYPQISGDVREPFEGVFRQIKKILSFKTPILSGFSEIKTLMKKLRQGVVKMDPDELITIRFSIDLSLVVTIYVSLTVFTIALALWK